MGRLVRLAQNVITGEIIKKGDFKKDFELLNLVCDEDSNIVYYKFSERVVDVWDGRSWKGKVGYMAPYLGPNGKICRLEGCEIREIL